MRPVSVAFLFSLAVLSGCATNVEQVEVKDAIEITDQSKVKPIAITKVVAKIKRGTEVGKLTVGWVCAYDSDIKWRSGSKVQLSSEELVDVFREELEANGWPVVGSTDDLFEGYDVSGAEVLVAGRITALEAHLCAPNAGFGNWAMKGSMRMNVEWQVYSPARRTLVGKITTAGSSRLDKPSDEASYDLLADSFGIAVNNLLASEEFLDLVERSEGLLKAPEDSIATLINNDRPNYQTMDNALTAAKRSTITIRTATGHGSGFAVGDGSFVLTNAHVVGDAQNVTIVSSGGLAIEATVVGASKERDVALISLNSVRLPPLHIEPVIPPTGSEVFAIGSPLAEQLSGSVTKGVVSGTRMLDGYKWIQSDASVSPGNSGGPLINSNGSVVAITTAGFQPGGTQAGLNLFIPIHEALTYVGLGVKP